MYDNTSGSNETVISSRMLSTRESTFKRPLVPQTYHKVSAPDAFKSQLDVSFLAFVFYIAFICWNGLIGNTYVLFIKYRNLKHAFANEGEL